MGANLEVYTQVKYLLIKKGEEKIFSDNQKLNISIAHPH